MYILHLIINPWPRRVFIEFIGQRALIRMGTNRSLFLHNVDGILLGACLEGDQAMGRAAFSLHVAHVNGPPSVAKLGVLSVAHSVKNETNFLGM